MAKLRTFQRDHLTIFRVIKSFCTEKLQRSTPVLRRQRYMYVHLNGFHARPLISFKIRIHIRNNMRYLIRLYISHRPQWVLPCLSVTLSNIISLLIYPAAFVSLMLYHVLSHKLYENIISRNMIRAQISTVNSLPYISFRSPSNCDDWLQK